jgi:hypothetical protein
MKFQFQRLHPLRELIPELESILGPVTSSGTELKFNDIVVQYHDGDSEFWNRTMGHFFRQRTVLIRDWQDDFEYKWTSYDWVYADHWKIVAISNIELIEFKDGSFHIELNPEIVLEIDDDLQAIETLLLLDPKLKELLSNVIA